MLKVIDLSYESNGIEVKNIEFEVEQGDFYIIFGIDDAGKTEIINAVMGIAQIYKGDILYKEENIRKLHGKERSSIRFVPDGILLLKEKAKDYFRSVQRAYKMKDLELLEELVEYFEIDTKESLMNMTYEQNKLVAIIGAIMTSPELLILDEPFNFLTVTMTKKLLQFLDKLNKNGTTIILSLEHYEDAQDMGTRFLYLKEGEVVKIGDIDSNKTRFKSITIKNASAKHLEKVFGVPAVVEDDSCTYFSDLEWNEIGDVLKEYDIKDKEIFIKMARMEDVLDFFYANEEVVEEKVEEGEKV